MKNSVWKLVHEMRLTISPNLSNNLLGLPKSSRQSEDVDEVFAQLFGSNLSKT